MTMPESDISSMQRKLKFKWILSSENRQDFVIIHIPQLNMTPVENNYANLSIKEINDTDFQHSHHQRSCQKRSKKSNIIN